MEDQGLSEIRVPQDGRLNQFINEKIQCLLVAVCPGYGRVPLFLEVATFLLFLDSSGGIFPGDAESNW